MVSFLLMVMLPNWAFLNFDFSISLVPRLSLFVRRKRKPGLTLPPPGFNRLGMLTVKLHTIT